MDIDTNRQWFQLISPYVFFESLFTSCLKWDFRCGKLLNHQQVSQKSCYSCWSNPLSHHKIIISQAKFRNIPHDIYIYYIYPYIPMIFPMILPCLGTQYIPISMLFHFHFQCYPLYNHYIVITVLFMFVYPILYHCIPMQDGPPKKISWFIINYNHH